MARPDRRGRVILAGTPLGHAGDASARLADAIATTPVIAAEDTRRFARLAADLGVGVAGQVLSFFEANESGRVPQLIELLRSGQDVLVVTDAGMPAISDPGYRLVVAALAAGVEVTALPGPSAVTTALALSGLAVDRFCFEGFLPRKSAARRASLTALQREPRTMVFFESPRRLGACLSEMADVFGADRPAAVCRELTKTYEQVRRGGLGELADWAAGEVRGEITVVVAGAADAGTAFDDVAAEVARRVDAGVARKDAIAEVAREAGLPKRAVYDAVLAAKP